jgi:FkbM family methyltransferase
MLSRLNWTEAAKERIAILKRYEPIQPYLLYELSKIIAADVFLDIGANIGAYSILMATLPSITEIHAFEPAPDTFGELLANVTQNLNSSKIKSHRVALSDRTDTVSFGLVSGLSGANSIVKTSIHKVNKFSRKLEISTTPLDTLIPLNQRVISIKIDVEGHESQALLGAVQTLSRNKCLIQIENYANTLEGLSKFFLENGYHWIFNAGPDNYFTNIELDNASVIEAFSSASSTMIAENFVEPDEDQVSPVRVSLPLGLTVEASGTLARRLRAFRNKLR